MTRVSLNVTHSSEMVLVVVTEKLHVAIPNLLNLLTALDTVSHKALLYVLRRFRIRKAVDCLLPGGPVIAGDMERIHIWFLQILSWCPPRLNAWSSSGFPLYTFV